MTEFSKAVAARVARWNDNAQAPDGNRECLERAARQLRECIHGAFPDSQKIKPVSDMVYYML
ncbi:MAG TPA: hypothetical protein VLA68_00095 [Nitrososphaera sp.]|nr:hypothetical protein [Nitrososphaera sp.]